MISKQKKRNAFLVVIGLSVASVTVVAVRLLFPAGLPAAGPETVAVPVIFSLTVTAIPGQAITIHVDSVILGAGYSLTDFRYNYNSRTDAACDGAGYSETSVASFTATVFY